MDKAEEFVEKVIIHFKDEYDTFINIDGTDIFERGEYFHVYNGNELVCIVLAETVKKLYKTKKRS